MPSAEAIAENKARSQARKVIMGLRLRGYKNADIARALGVEPSAVQRIYKGDTPGDTLLIPLQRLAAGSVGAQLPADTPAETPASGASPEQLEASAPTGGSLPADLEGFEAPETEQPAQPKGAVAKLKAMMLGGNDATATAPTRRSSSGEGQRGAFVAQVLPIVALAVVMGSDLAIKEPYKPVAPTQPEAEAMLCEPIKWLARELDVRGRLTENTMSLLITLLAVAAYAKRAHGTYKQIREAENVKRSRERSSGAVRGINADIAARGAANGYAPGGHGVTGADTADHAEHGASGGPRGSGRGPDASAAHGRAGGFLRGPAARDNHAAAPSGDDIMAAVMQADYEGRVQRGLL